MRKETKDILEFGPFRLDTGEAQLTRLGNPVALPPKVFDLLVCLASNAGRLMDKEELLRELWPDSFVEEANLTVNMTAVRRALGAQEDGLAWIETVPKRGYRFVGNVTRPAQLAQVVEPASAPDPVVPPEVPAARKFSGKYQIAATLLVLAACATYIYVHQPRRQAGGTQQVLAVLPFQDLAVDELHAGLGMTDALIAKLGSLPQLSVRTFATVRKYAAAGIDPIEAGRALGVDTVLTGSVQRLDKRVRVTVRLQRVRDGQSLWADKFDEFFTNIFAVQDDISEKLANVLALRLTSEDQDRMMRRYTESTDAYHHYELGRYERTANTIMAVEYFERSASEDPKYAFPHVELADIHLGASGNGAAAFEKHAPLAREEAATALRLSPELAEAHVAAGDVKRIIDRNYAGARAEIEAAVRLNPVSAKAHESRGLLAAIRGDLSAGVQELRAAERLDPFNAEISGDLVWLLYCSRQFQNALDALDDFARRDTRTPSIDWNRFYCYLKLSKFQEAIELMEKARANQSAGQAVAAALAHAYAVAGRSKDALAQLKLLRSDWGFYQRAVVELALGDRDAAIEHLASAVDEHSVWVEWMGVDPDLDPIRSDLRYAKIIAGLGLNR